MKRSFASLFEDASAAYEPPSCVTLNPRKKLKRALQIDISDSYTEKAAAHSSSSTKNANARKLSFGTALNNQPYCMVKNAATPRCTERSKFAFEPNVFFMENDTMYDNFSQEEEAFNITMKKCHRKRMEDRVTCETGFDSTGVSTFFFGIYDGHRNSYVSDYLQRNLHTTIQNSSDVQYQPIKAIKEAFSKIDQEVLKNQEALNIQGGSTALCAYIRSNSLYLANVGDSKAIVIRDGLPVTLNIEHRANNEEERKNVENRGGYVFEKKGATTSRFLVQGALELTRSIGDPSYKEFITCEPDVKEYKFDKHDQYIIMASDGFWNEFNEEETVKLVNSHNGSKGLSEFLVNEALKKKHHGIDNISLIVVDVQKLLRNSL